MVTARDLSALVDLLSIQRSSHVLCFEVDADIKGK